MESGIALPEYVGARPHPELAGLVVGYSGYREHSAAPLRRRQVPTSACPLILSLDPPIRLHGPAGPVVRRSFAAGMHDAAVVTEFVGAQAGVQVDLTPLGMFTLLGRPMTDLSNRTPPLDELGCPQLAALPARLADEPGWCGRFALVDSVLRALLDAGSATPDPEVAWAWRRLVGTGGSAQVGELAAGTGWSRRHLLSRFSAQVGLAPKAAARVLRFQRAANLLVPAGPGGGPGTPGARTVSDVAAAAGYADHSHLVREFRALAGCTPTQYVAEFPFVQDPPRTPA